MPIAFTGAAAGAAAAGAGAGAGSPCANLMPSACAEAPSEIIVASTTGYRTLRISPLQSQRGRFARSYQLSVAVSRGQPTLADFYEGFTPEWLADDIRVGRRSVKYP